MSHALASQCNAAHEKSTYWLSLQQGVLGTLMWSRCCYSGLATTCVFQAPVVRKARRIFLENPVVETDWQERKSERECYSISLNRLRR